MRKEMTVPTANIPKQRSRALVRQEDGETEDLVKMYFRDLKVRSLLTQEQEAQYIRRIRQNDLQAKEEFVSYYLRFVVKVVKTYSHYKLPLIDLISEGNVGLLRAIETFEVKKGYRFVSYAIWWIKQAVTRYIWKNLYAVSLPKNLLEQQRHLLEEEQEVSTFFTKTPKRFPSTSRGYRKSILTNALTKAASLDREMTSKHSSKTF